MTSVISLYFVVITVINVEAAVAYGRKTVGDTIAPKTNQTNPRIRYAMATKSENNTIVHLFNFKYIFLH